MINTKPWLYPNWLNSESAQKRLDAVQVLFTLSDRTGGRTS